MREVLSLEEGRYDPGDITLIDVLQARVSINQARANNLEANYSYNGASTYLRQAI